MKRLYTKLVALSLSLVLSISVVVASSYAWMTLSENPAVEGIQISIAGGNTILIAPDMVHEVAGEKYHYPGGFTDTINFGYYSSYNYLSELAGLTPVSTSDGLTWYLPDYYDASDEEVQSGMIASGTLKDVAAFSKDEYLTHANVPFGEKETGREGSYVYLDFWVVSPGDDYRLRISTGDDSVGSFLLGAMLPNKDGDNYSLSLVGEDAAACARVGFLVNSNQIVDNTMGYYQSSSGYSSQYTSLRGPYTEPGDISQTYSDSYRFTIYEPNGDSHPSYAEINGSYVITEPLGEKDGMITPIDVRDRLTVQLTNQWKTAQYGEGTLIEQIFRTAVTGRENTDLSEATEYFYRDYLQWQISTYVKKAAFVRNTGSLYSYADQKGNGLVDETYFAQNVTAGATDDVYIVDLEKNVPQRIRMFIWLEGQDVDCTNEAAASAFVLNLELAGSN